MKPPTLAEIQAYIDEKNLNVDAKLFWLKNEERAREERDGSTTWMRGKQPMKRWRMCLQIHHEGGWCKTSASDKRFKERNQPIRKKVSQADEDALRAKKTAALEDMLKDKGQEAQRLVGIIMTILAERAFESRRVKHSSRVPRKVREIMDNRQRKATDGKET